MQTLVLDQLNSAYAPVLRFKPWLTALPELTDVRRGMSDGGGPGVVCELIV